MVCYQCGVRLSEHDFCTGCGADVALYKQILSASNRLYNEGLEKASVRDLAGAVAVLRQSLKYNKNNIKARNLLGLVYFEMGEAVSALSEWVISKNIRPNRNIADDYITMIQTNQTRLDTINQTIRKFNQALAYCYQESHDLAIIQLKKVLSYNPKYVRAHQLLALLYIRAEEWNLAKAELVKCSEIDANNTITLRYLLEVGRMMMPEDVAKQGSAKPKPADEVVRYQSGNETIIQPGKSRDFRILTVLFNFGIGISIGIAITISLIMPAQLRSERDSAAEQVRTVGEELDNKTAAIADLEARVERLMEENGYLDQELSAYRGTDISVEASDNLLLAAAAYILGPADGVILNGDGVETPLIEIIANFMEAVPPEEVTVANPAYKELYDSIVSVKGKELGDYYFATGDELYRGQEYNSAIPYLARAFQYDKTNGDALYYLARSYDWIGETDKAKEAYAQVIELFPDTDKATNSDNRLVEINMTGASG